MSYHVLLHQFEIRFSNMLDFPKSVNTVLSPFVKLATRVGISNENSRNEIIELRFEPEFYKIRVYWDRVVITTQIPLEKQILNNSVIEEPFLNIFDKISQLDSFGSVKNILHYTIILALKNNKSRNESFQEIKKHYLTNNTKKLLSDFDEIGISLSKSSDSEIEEIQIGNFVGKQDFERRNIEFFDKSIEKLLEESGELLEIKFFEKKDNIRFSDYKKITQKALNKINMLWE